MANKPSPWGKQPIEFGKPMSPEVEKRAREGLAGKLLEEEALATRILRGLEQHGEGYRAYVKYPKDKSGFATIGSIIGGHYSHNEQGFTVWVDAWERDPGWPRTNILGIKQSRRFGPVGEPATIEGVITALRYVNQAFPDYTEVLWVNNSIPVNIAVELGILGKD